MGRVNRQCTASHTRPISTCTKERTDRMPRFAKWTFAFVHCMTRYKVYGPRHECINAVLYKDVSDEKQPHCDGHCHGKLDSHVE
jgi:hypothetical protein